VQKTKPRHAKPSRGYVAVTAAAAAGVTGAALPFGLAYASAPPPPPSPRTMAQSAALLPAHRAAPAVKASGAALPGRYTVRRGDTLSAIARRFCGNPGDYPALAANSGIADPDVILPGEVVRLACHAAAAAFAAHVSAAPPPADPKRVSAAAPVTRGVTAVVTSVGGRLGCSGLEALWDAAGGNSADAFMAAEIAMAESGGNQYALSPTDDRGYWQINASNGALSTFSAYGNARSAILLSDDGTNWSPWTTYTNNLYEGRC
jgi:Lysozyme like domain/LysM domain